MTVVQFERLPRIKTLLLDQYGTLKCVTVVQFKSRRLQELRSQFLTAGLVWETEMRDS